MTIHQESQLSDEISEINYPKKTERPGKNGIESIGRNGNYCSSPISNYYCAGYQKE
jgi:hypothetical protein